MLYIFFSRQSEIGYRHSSIPHFVRLRLTFPIVASRNIISNCIRSSEPVLSQLIERSPLKLQTNWIADPGNQVCLCPISKEHCPARKLLLQVIRLSLGISSTTLNGSVGIGVFQWRVCHRLPMRSIGYYLLIGCK